MAKSLEDQFSDNPTKDFEFENFKKKNKVKRNILTILNTPERYNFDPVTESELEDIIKNLKKKRNLLDKTILITL